MPDTASTDSTTETTTAAADATASTATATTTTETATSWDDIFKGEDPAKVRKALDHAREWEKRSKENADKAKRLDEIEEASASELDKANKRAEQAAAVAATAQAQLAVASAALKHGVAEADLTDFADAVGTHGSAEDLAARAEKLAPRFKAATPTARPDFGAGDRGDDVKSGADQLTKEDVSRLMAAGKHAEVSKARQEGRLNDVLGIK